jgi:hypothetical protein
MIHVFEEQAKALGPIATGVVTNPAFSIFVSTLNKPEF